MLAKKLNTAVELEYNSIQKDNILSLSKYISIQKFLNPANKKAFQWAIKRALDIAASLFGIIALSPIWLLIIILIKLDSRGPILYKQKRIGLYRREFYMYKFRSMVCDAEKKLDEIKHKNQTNVVMFKMKDDPRVTRIGKFMRKFSIDEFPQLLNVLKGEMSLVGPRPPIPSEVEQYEDWHYVRFSALPGLTGKWQVSGRSQIKSFDQVVNLDLSYIRNWSFWADITILFKTVPVVVLGRE